MNPRMRVIVTLVGVFVLIVALYTFTNWFSRATGYVLGEDKQLQFVACLNAKPSILYTKLQCTDCYRQEELFAPAAYDQLNVVSCDELDCSNFRSMPAWQIGNAVYYGLKDFRELSELSGCSLETQ